MKMSEVFNLPLTTNAQEYIMDSKGHTIGSEIFAITHAINCHDDLVKELDGMIKLNEKMIREFNGRVEPWNQIDEEHLHDAAVLVAKAKGE